MAADPPGASSHLDDGTTTDEYHHERPLVCSNPLSYSYASSSGGGSFGSSYRTRLLPPHPHDYRYHDDHGGPPPSPRRGAHAAAATTREVDRTPQSHHRSPFRRTTTGFTDHESYFDDPHRFDPVESVCAPDPSVAGTYWSSRSRGGGASSLWEEEPPDHRPDPSVADEGRMVAYGRSSRRSGRARGELGADDPSDDDVDVDEEDEDNGEEHYRPRHPTAARRTRPPDPDPLEEETEPTEEWRLASPGPRPLPEPMDERRLVVRPERNLEPKAEERRVKSSHEVVATIKNQLALADNEPQKYDGYEHCFITVEEHHRFLVLYTFLRSHRRDKVIIFFSTTKSTQYYARLLNRLDFDDVSVVHNGQTEEQFLDEFFRFSRCRGGGILCIPDFQGVAINVPPSASWIVQFEPCADPSEYIFRVGRISTEPRCGGGGGGGSGGAAFDPPPRPRALLFLTPSQFGFLKYFRAAGVRFSEYEIPRLDNVQRELVRTVRDDGRLGRLGAEAYGAYLVAYAGHEYRDIYDVHGLDPRKVARCFGFDRPPKKDGDGDTDAFEGKEPGPRFREGAREQNRWKPKKNERGGWMRGKKSWMHADVHTNQMRVGEAGKTDPNKYKPKSIKF